MGVVGGRQDDIIICRYVTSVSGLGALLIVKSLGPDAAESISCLAMSGDAVWASTGHHAIKYLRGREVSTHLRRA